MDKIKMTKHADARQTQRGITSMMVDYVFGNGVEDRDKFIIDRNGALSRIAEIENEKRLLMKILDKGGVVVVAQGDAVITTYNRTASSKRASRNH